MCGIVAYVGHQDAVPILVSGLTRLEYRGYDSAGVAVLTRSGLRVHKRAGKLRELEAALPARLKGLKGGTGIGHTRWATHGAPSDANAHPHTDAEGRIAVVHNGIFENAAALRAELEADGCRFRSDTDTEVLAHLIARSPEPELADAVREALSAVEGTYGVAVLDARHPGCLVVARNGSPVIVGVGEREMFAASDVSALVRHTSQVVHLEDGELAVLEPRGFRSVGGSARPLDKRAERVAHGPEAYERGEHEHWLVKEIFEQPEACERTLRGRLDLRFQTAHLGGLDLGPRDVLEIRRVRILGCGSALYAGALGAHLLETLTRLPADAEPAAEFRYRHPVIEKDTLYVAVSQSGETFDTLAAVREVKRKGGRVLGIVNSVGSSIAREVDGGIYTHAGPEVSVASTKTWTCTLVAFALLALHLGRIRDLSPGDGRRLIDALRELPGRLREVLAGSDAVRAVAETRLAPAASAFYVGRGTGWATAREGAQKLKEVAYVHAEAYPASELKHGPLALVGPEIPTVAVVPSDDLRDKMLASLEEIRARRGPLVVIGHSGDTELARLADAVIEVPRSHPALDGVLLNVPLQLLAYHCAVSLGRDVDQPRNLAKSVTVE